MSFMMEIDAARSAQHTPLDMLVTDYLRAPVAVPSLDFCRRVAGVPDSDETVARRLGIAISIVRGWRELGRRAKICR